MKEWSNIIAIAAGECHTVGLKADGTVVATGFNKQEQCNVSEWSDIVAIAAGGFHTVGLKADGTIVTAGGTFSSFNFTASLWRNIVAIAVGGHNTVGLKADGTVVAVGFDEYGQCDIGEWNLFK